MGVHVYNQADLKADLYARIPGDGEYEFLSGDTILGDIPPSLWQYDASSSATDNFAGGVIQPTAQMGNGRWLRRYKAAVVATSGAYSDLSGTPSLAAVAISGAYSDLSGKPSLSAVATSGAYSDLSGKPSLAAVATSGAYSDLSGKPSIPAAQIQSDWAQGSSGSLDFIKNKPTIPAAQIQADWTQASSGALDYIKNKPSTAAISQSTPADPSTTTSATGVMMGLAASITPVVTGRLMIAISGTIDNNTLGDGAQVQIRYGTGTAPTNGASLTGTTAGGLVKQINASLALLVPGAGPFALNAIVTGLTLSTAVWIDVSLARITGGTARVRDISISAVEL